MSSVYSGNPAGGARSPAVNPTIPADADLANVASVNAAFQKLADYIAWLQANTPGLGEANTFTQAQLIQALLTLTNNVSLTAAVAQSILKTAAGGLTFGTAATGGDLTLSANGVALLKLLASGSLDAQGKILGNLGAPVSVGDALRKETPVWTAITPATGWTAGTGGQAPRYLVDISGNVRFRGQLTAGATASYAMAMGVVPVARRPTGDRYVPIVDATSFSLVIGGVNTSGDIGLMPLPVTGHTYDLSGFTLAPEQ